MEVMGFRVPIVTILIIYLMYSIRTRKGIIRYICNFGDPIETIPDFCLTLNFAPVDFVLLGKVQNIWAAALRHDQFGHVMGNIFWLLLYGYSIEKYFGHMRYLLLINVLIVTEAVIQILFALYFEHMVNDDSLMMLRYQGISGVIYGLMAIKHFYLRPIWSCGIDIIDTYRLLAFKEPLEFTYTLSSLFSKTAFGHTCGFLSGICVVLFLKLRPSLRYQKFVNKKNIQRIRKGKS